MRVLDQNVARPVRSPFECQPPLIVDPDMPSAVIFLQVIAGRCLREVHRGCRVQLGQFSFGDALDVDKATALAGRE